MATAIPTDQADIRRELGALLHKIRKDAKMTCVEIAEIAGHTQSWWSKQTRGWAKSVDIAALRQIDVELGLPRETSARMYALADALNESSHQWRGVLAYKGSTTYREWERTTVSAPLVRVSSPDTIPIPLWCKEFGEAVTADEDEHRQSALRATALQWRDRLDDRSTMIEWRLGEAAVRRRCGLPTDVLAAQVEHLRGLANGARRGCRGGIVPFDAELMRPVPSLCITDDFAVIDVGIGIIRYPDTDMGRFVTEFEALPIVSGADAVAVLDEVLAGLTR